MNENNDKINWAQKLSSRTFWITVAAVLGSLAGSIAALGNASELVQTVGVAAGIIAAAILAGVYVNGEKKLDIARVEAGSVQTSVSLTSSNASVVKDLLNPSATPVEGTPKDGQE